MSGWGVHYAHSVYGLCCSHACAHALSLSCSLSLSGSSSPLSLSLSLSLLKRLIHNAKIHHNNLSQQKLPGVGSSLQWPGTEVSLPVPQGESRGECSVCKKYVYSTQERCRGDEGNYLHLKCFDSLTANIEGLDPE